MDKRILVIDDDYYTIQGVFYPLERDGCKLDFALSALDGYHKILQRGTYDLIILDLIITTSSFAEESIPEIVKSWEDETRYAYVGIGLIIWLLQIVKIECPVVVFSLVPDPINAYNLGSLGIARYIPKSGLLPSILRDEVYKCLK